MALPPDNLLGLTLSASVLRFKSPRLAVSRNGRFRAVLTHPAHGRTGQNLWTMTDTRNGRVYTRRTDTYLGHVREIRSIVRFEDRCWREGDRPMNAPR